MASFKESIEEKLSDLRVDVVNRPLISMILDASDTTSKKHDPTLIDVLEKVSKGNVEKGLEFLEAITVAMGVAFKEPNRQTENIAYSINMIEAAEKLEALLASAPKDHLSELESEALGGSVGADPNIGRSLRILLEEFISVEKVYYQPGLKKIDRNGQKQNPKKADFLTSALQFTEGIFGRKSPTLVHKLSVSPTIVKVFGHDYGNSQRIKELSSELERNTKPRR